MTLLFRTFAFLAIIAGIVTLVSATRSNRTLTGEVQQLEAELGRMSIDDESKIHIVAIENPEIPPEVVSHVDQVWQFRCYLPAGYDFRRFSGGGRVSDQGVFFRGGFGSGWSSPPTEPVHQILTISLCRSGESVECFTTFGGSSSTTSWNALSAGKTIRGDWVFETLAIPGGPAQSFDQDTILPVLRVYDPNTAEEQQVNTQSITTYQGGLILFCPQSLAAEFEMLRKGETPDGSKALRIAEGQRQ